MKKGSAGKRIGVTVVMLAVVMGFLLSANVAFSQLIEGDYCWTLRVTENEKGPTDEKILVKMHLTSLDPSDTYFTVHSKVNVRGDNPAVLGGTAMVSGDTVYFSLMLTQDHRDEPWRDTEILQARVNTATLNGIIWGVRNDYNRTTRTFEPGYTSGKLTSRTCP